MKFEVTVKTEDGKVVGHQIVDENKKNASKFQMAKSSQIRSEKPKEQSHCSKFLSWCKCKKPKSSAKQEKSEKLDGAEESDLETEDEWSESNESEPSAVEEEYVASEPKPKRTATVAPKISDNFPSEVPVPDDSKLGDSSTNQKATLPIPSEVDVEEDKPAQKQIAPKTLLRGDEEGHWPMFDKRPVESMCEMKNCRTPTRVYCEKCNLHLCFNVSRNCFYKFHKQNHHIRADNNKHGAKSSGDTRKQRKPLNKIRIRPNKTDPINSKVNDKTTIKNDRNKSRFPHRNTLKDATKEKAETRPGKVPLKVHKISRVT